MGKSDNRAIDASPDKRGQQKKTLREREKEEAKKKEQGQAYLAQYKVQANTQLNFIHAYHEKPYGYDLNHVVDMARIDHARSMEGCPSDQPINHMSTVQIRDLKEKRNAQGILALDNGEGDFGMGNFVKKNIKFGV